MFFFFVASLEEKLQALEVDVMSPSSLPQPPYMALRQQQQVDSGYLSQASNGQSPAINGSNKMPLAAGINSGLLLQTVEAQLKPHTQTSKN